MSVISSDFETPTGGFSFTKESRLLKRRQFLALSRRQPRPDVVINAGSFLVLGRGNDLKRNRLGVTVTKKTASRAVVRNRIKRQVREYFRVNVQSWPQGLDLLFIARPGAARLTGAGLREDLKAVGRKLSARVASSPGPEASPKPGRGEKPGIFISIITVLNAWPGWLALGLIRFYQCCVSPFTPPACRFWPTCSNYALVAVQRHGFWRGSWLAVRRLLKCHPFHPGGYDPVPPSKPRKRQTSRRAKPTVGVKGEDDLRRVWEPARLPPTIKGRA